MDGLAGFAAVAGSFKPKTGIGVDAIHPRVGRASQKRCKQLHTDLLNDVERTLACANTNPDRLSGPRDTDWRATHPIHTIHRACVGANAQAWSGSVMISQTRPHDWACKGRSAEMAAWQRLVLEEGQDGKPGIGRATALLDMTKLLRIILVVFSFQRRVGLWGSVSAIIAGSVFSCVPSFTCCSSGLATV